VSERRKERRREEVWESSCPDIVTPMEPIRQPIEAQGIPRKVMELVMEGHRRPWNPMEQHRT
jgi:hypothetical protein